MTDVENRIEREMGLVRVVALDNERVPAFVHPATQQQFVLIPGGTFAMGMSRDELIGALREVGYDPDIAFWRSAHRKRYEAATPVHAVTIQPFLCGRSPLLGGAVDATGLGVRWSVHETAEHSDSTAAAELRAEDATRVLAHYSWKLINEAQWEYVARCGGRDQWAGGSTWRKTVDKLVNDPRCTKAFTNSNAWGIWGCPLGEWIADQWHENYVGAPIDGSAWGDAAPTAIRGGGVLHAPWQDSDEAISCHAAIRHGEGSWRGIFRARPVLALPWLHTDVASAQVSPRIDFDTAVSELDRELREAKQTVLRERAQKVAMRHSMHEAVQIGHVRSVGDDGVYIVKLATMNGILRAPELSRPLRVGDVVHIRIVGTGGVPELALADQDGTGS